MIEWEHKIQEKKNHAVRHLLHNLCVCFFYLFVFLHALLKSRGACLSDENKRQTCYVCNTNMSQQLYTVLNNKCENKIS